MINKNIKIPGLGTTEFNKLKQNATKQPKTSNTQDEDYDVSDFIPVNKFVARICKRI